MQSEISKEYFFREFILKGRQLTDDEIAYSLHQGWIQAVQSGDDISYKLKWGFELISNRGTSCWFVS